MCNIPRKFVTKPRGVLPTRSPDHCRHLAAGSIGMAEQEFFGNWQEDETAFRALYAAYASRIYNTVLSYVQHPAEAEELTQDIFVKLYETGHTYAGNAQLSTWIYRIAVNASLDHLRKRAARKRAIWRTSSLADAPEPTDFVHPGIQLERQEDSRHLFRCIDQLPERQKTAFMLSYIEELPQAEVATIMQLSVKAVESLLSRSKKNLRKKLEKHDPERRR